MRKGKKKVPGWAKFFLGVMAGVVIWTVYIEAQKQAQGCGGSGVGSQNTSSFIAHGPTISVQTIEWELKQRGSPLSANDAAYIYQESQRYTIDDAFALAIWAEETQDGRLAVQGTHNIGNITAGEGVAAAGHIFAVYPDWQAGIDAWFSLIKRLYIQGGHASDLLTFALYYVNGHTPEQASAAEKKELQNGYVASVQSITSSLQAYETQHSVGSSGSASAGSNTQAATLASLIPDTLPPSWAGGGVLQAAATIPISCGGSTSGGNPLVLAAMQLAAYLVPDENGFFARWGAGAPSGVLSQAGITWCTDFVASAYQRATGKSFIHYPDAGNWLDNPASLQPDFVKVLAGPNSFPQAGDIIVLQDSGAGHVAIAVGVQLPQGAQNGWVLVAQGHTTHVLEKWTLASDGTLTPNWGYPTRVPGYIRIPSLTVTSQSLSTSNLNDYPWQGLTYADGGDPWGMAYGQCVSYVAWKIYELSGGTQRPPSHPAKGWKPSDASLIPINWNWGNAGDWAANATVPVDHTPRVGDVAQWNNGSDNGAFSIGHVALVYQVNSDGSIDLAQYNLREDSKFSTMHITRQGATDTSNGHGAFFVTWPDNFIHIPIKTNLALHLTIASAPQGTAAPETDSQTRHNWQANASGWMNPQPGLLFCGFLAVEIQANGRRRGSRARRINRSIWHIDKTVLSKPVSERWLRYALF